MLQTGFFREKYEHRHIHIHNYVHIHFKKKKTFIKTSACTRLGGWLCGCVVWCSAVCCCRGVLVLGILKLEIGKIQRFLPVNL